MTPENIYWSFSNAKGLVPQTLIKPCFAQLGSTEKVNTVPVVQVTSLLPLLTEPESIHVTVTTVPGFTGNCVVVSIVLVHSVFSPVQDSGAVNFRFVIS